MKQFEIHFQSLHIAEQEEYLVTPSADDTFNPNEVLEPEVDIHEQNSYEEMNDDYEQDFDMNEDHDEEYDPLKTESEQKYVKLKGKKFMCYFRHCRKMLLPGKSCTHIREKHHGSLTCGICKEKFQDINFALKHQAEIHGNLMQCRYCDKEYSSYNNFRAHVKMHEDEQQQVQYTCDVCGKQSKTLPAFQAHKKYAHAEKSYKCTECDYKTSYPSCLKIHLQTHDANRQEHFCDHCGRSYTRALTLRHHLYVSHQIGKPVKLGKRAPKKDRFTKIECYFLGCDYFTEFSHPEHMKKHGGDTVCKICGLKSRGISSALRHWAKAHGNPMICKACYKEFTNYEGFRAHWLEHEQLPKPHVCDHCGKDYYLKSELTSHIKRLHDNQPFKCNLCDFQDSKNYNLQRHMKTHEVS